MNEYGTLNELYAPELVRRRRADAARSRTHLPPAQRRTTRRSLARGLHRLADRLDG